MSTAYAVARVIVQRTGISFADAYTLTLVHRNQIDHTIIASAERIIRVEAQRLRLMQPAPSPDQTIQPETAAPSQLESVEAPAKQPHIQLGPNLIPLETDEEVKSAKKQGYTIIMQ